MALRIYDTQRHDKVPFEPMEPGKVRMYVCGVTVYDMCHIGHARVMVAFDVVYRFLRARGYEVTYVRNFTDVDDKIIRRANERGVSWRELTDRYIAEFYRDFDALGCLRPDVEPRVSEHIPQIVDLVQNLIERGHAYVAGGDVYFDVDSFEGYGMRLARCSLDDMMAGACGRVSEDEQARKRSPLDFALWKASKPGEPSWPSPWGEGRPGWHIECSAMSVAHLGETFDIHGGGQDLVFPHHENEIAQSVGGYGGEFARHWMHVGFVKVDDEKMSKSLGNFFTVRDVLDVYHPDVVRYFLLSTHYRSPINYTERNLDLALRRVLYIYETLDKIDRFLEGRPAPAPDAPVHEPELVRGFRDRFDAALEDDFNTARALGYLSDLVRFANEIADRGKKKAPHKHATLHAIREAMNHVAAVLGVFEHPPAEVLGAIGEQLARRYGIDRERVERLVAERTEARAARDWERADAIRAELDAMRVQVMDTPQGTRWKLAPPEVDEAA